MSDLDAGAGADSFATIPDVPVAPETNRVTPNMVATGTTRGIQQLGSEKVYSDGGNAQIIVKDSSNARVLMGKQATFGEGFYVSKAGVDATTNTDAAQWAFNSNQNVFKIVQTGTYTTTINYNSATPAAGQFGRTFFTVATIPHGLSYIPAIIGYQSDGAGGYYLMPYTAYAATGSTAFWGTWFFSTDSTNVKLYLDIMSYGGGITYAPGFPFKYYLLQETAN